MDDIDRPEVAFPAPPPGSLLRRFLTHLNPRSAGRVVGTVATRVGASGVTAVRRLGRTRAIVVSLALVASLAAVTTVALTVGGPPSGSDALAGQQVDWRDEPSDAELSALGAADRGQDTGAGRAEQFYFVLPDRFANGDPGNDRGGLSGDRLSTGLDRTDKGFYHGGDIKGVIDRLDYIEGLGTTAIWLAPVFKNRPVQGTGADASAGYHGYWITDFTQIDPHFGTNADLERLVREAHRRGMKIYLDVITNHTADVISYAEGQYTYRGKDDFPYEDAAGNPFEDRNYAAGGQPFPTMDADGFPYTPVFANPAHATVKVPAWLNDPTMYHNRGDSTFAGENSEYGDFFGLDDLWTERPEVVAGLTKIYQEWIAKTGVDGFRIDTTKHVNMAFWPQFTRGIEDFATRRGNPDFFMFGEVFSADVDFASSYVRQGGLPATLDFAFQDAAAGFAASGSSPQRLAAVYARDDLYTVRDTSAARLPTFLGNHDMGRIGMFVQNGVASSADEKLQRAILAEELMFLTRGQPVVYSGDEQGFTGAGGDKDARQDMFASEVAEYVAQPLLGTTNTHAVDNYDTQHPIYRSIAELAQLRRQHAGLRDGSQVTRYAADNGPGVLAVSRVGADRTEYLVAFNNSTVASTVSVPTYSAGMGFTPIYPHAGATVTTAADTTIGVTVPPLAAVVLKAVSPIALPTTGPGITLAMPVSGQGVSTRTEVVADVTTEGPASVTFAVKLGDAGWKLLGTADRQPYRVYHDLNGLPANTPLVYKAVVTDANDRTASARTEAFVATPAAGASRNTLLVHYERPDGDYDPWGLYTWGDIDPSSTTPWPSGLPFAGQDSYGRFAWVKLAPGARSVGFLVVDSGGVKDVEADRVVDPSLVGEIWLKSGDPTIYTSRAAATRTVTVHYGRPDGQYAGWGLHLWGDGLAPGAGTDWATPRQPDGTDSFGAFWHVPVGDPAKPVNFIIHKGDEKDPGPDQGVIPAVQGEAWVVSGDTRLHASRAAADNVAVLHYRRPDGNYSGWGLHLWTGAASPTEWTSPLPPASIDSYGAVFRVPLADGATSLSYIVHRGDEKDLPADQSLDLAGKGHEVWLLAGQERYLLPQPTTAAPDTNLSSARAQWLDRSTVAWAAGPSDGRRYSLVYDPDGGITAADGVITGASAELRLVPNATGLAERLRLGWPHLWRYATFSVDRRDLSRVTTALRGQVVAVERDHEGKVLAATSVQIPGVLDDVYADATRAKLGPTFDRGRPSLAVWAPTARSVALELFDTPAATPAVVAMRRDDGTGVWRVTGAPSWKGKYYRFRVTAWQPASQQVVTASVTDPYSVALAADSTHSQLVDLSDGSYAPAGWADLRKPDPVRPGQIQIQELSVRDFSIADTTVPGERRGTYLAFTEAGAAGMTHLRELAGAGLTHVHLMPVFDFATTPERRAEQATPTCDLPALPPDSDQQQACVAAVAATDGYNWGYDPWHYTTPEGSFATQPEGAARTREFRRMVSALNQAGLRVVLDVVYNHTTAAGADSHSVLDQIVPGYYHRLLDEGTLATSTCCANTAPEHAMMGKLVVDSVVTWARQYKVDGFRFDLMGHHPKANILAVRQALDALTPQRDGVDGRKIYLYGEGWDFGEVAGDARFVQATQANMAGTGIGTFNDRLRDAVRGGGPFDGNPRIQGFASGLFADPNGDPVNGSASDQRARLLHHQDQIKVGLAGNLAGFTFVDTSGRTVTGAQVDYNGSPAGYADRPADAVTYVDAHDNEILYDALAFKLPVGTSPADRARMQVLALATAVLSQGVGFAAGGSDLMRSKSFDKNSYNSGDWFNQIRWDCAAGAGFGAGLPPAADNASRWPYAQPLLANPALRPDCASIELASARYQELLRIRASSPLFGLETASQVGSALSFPLSGPGETPGVITMKLTDIGPGSGLDRQWRSIVVVFNATPTGQAQTLGALAGASVSLHPGLRDSADPSLDDAAFDPSTGTFTIPARSVAVFVQS
jgi:pullulanase-type alpha-1,6-glucosidase